MRAHGTSPLRARVTAVGCGALVVLAGCSGGTTPAAEAPDEGRTLTVLAAASLTEGFTELESLFEAGHPRTDVRISFDSSATLAQQAVAGAPADVLATADASTMAIAEDGGVLAQAPQVFATNTMVLVTPADNPATIEEFADLDDPDVVYVACVESAPCGALAQSLLSANDIDQQPSSLEVDVKAVLNKVALDEADAGLVYTTDAATAVEDVNQIKIPGARRERTEYPIAPLAQAADAELAQDWVDLVVSEEGQAILAGYGFGPASVR